MMKKIALIVIVIGIISISLVFTLPVLSQVNSTVVDGTVYEETFDQVMNVSNISYRIMQAIPIILAAGGLVIAIGFMMSRKNRKGRSSRYGRGR